MNEEPEKITEDTFPKYKPAAHDFPPHLKDPANYNKIQLALLDTLASKHSHGDMAEWAACASCQKKMHEHAETMRKLGFETPQHYMAWKRIHAEIKKRIPYAKYDD